MAVPNSWGLPLELWGEVFSFVPKQDLPVIQLVCRIFKQASTDCLRSSFGPIGTLLPWESKQVKWNGGVNQIVTYLQEKVKNRKTYDPFFLKTVAFLVRIGYPLNLLDAEIGSANFDKSLSHLGKDLPLALEHYDKVLNKLKVFRSERTLTISIVAHYVGILYLAHDSNVLAKTCFYFAQNTLKKVDGDQRLHTAAVLRSMGSALFKEGLSLVECLAPFNQCLEILENVLGKEHAEVAHCLMDVGTLYCDKSYGLAAISPLKKALEIFKKVYGEVNPYVAVCLMKLGETYILHKPEEALEHLTKSLQILKIVYADEEHPDIARVLDTMMDCFYEKTDFSQAIKYGVQALALNIKIYGKDHLKVAGSLYTLKELYWNRRDFSEAIKCGLAASEIYAKEGDAFQVMVARMFLDTGKAYRLLGDIPNAVKYLTSSLTICEKIGTHSQQLHIKSLLDQISRS